jgi:glycosyltransferase involved in cell wall biosynthesis
MNVLFVNATRTWGGVKTWMLELAAFLGRRGHGVVMVCRPGDAMADLCPQRGVSCRTVRFGPDLSPVTVAWFLRAFREHATDVVVTNISKDLRTAGVAARLRGIAHVNRLGAVTDVRDEWRTRAAYERLVDRVIVPSRVLGEQLGRLAFLRQKLRVHPNAVVPAPFVERPDSCPKFAVLAKLSARKQVDRILHAFANIPDLPWELHVGGHGPDLPALMRLADGLGLSARVRFACAPGPGFTKVDPHDFLADKTVGLLYSTYESFGYAVIEYMAHSCAVIASRTDGTRDLIEDGVNGLLVDPADPGTLERAVRAMISDPGRRQALARAGYATVCRRFHQDVVFPAVEAELADTIAWRRAGALRSAPTGPPAR